MKYLHFILLGVLLLISCSKADNSIAPSQNSEQWSIRNAPVSESTISQSENPYRGVFGAWEVKINPKTLTAELIPARNAKAIGHIFDADLSQFLTVAPCSDCLQIVGITYGLDQLYDLTVAMKHPFGNITARPDLHGFDVRGIFIFPSENLYDRPEFTVVKPDGTEEAAKFDLLYVRNADGYTSHYDELVNDERYFLEGGDYPANLNPYIRFFDDPHSGAFDPNAPSGHNVMPVGSGVDKKTVAFHLPLSTLEVKLYIIADVAYGQSAVFANRKNPQYYLPSFNRTESWRMEYFIENNNLNAADPSATADVVLQVFDWQHSAYVDSNYPSPANLAGLKESSKVAQVELLVPGLKDVPYLLTIPESGDGSPENPLQYRFTVSNELGNDYGSFFGYVAIRDELNGKAAPEGRNPVPESPSGFPYSTLDIRDYSYYQTIYIYSPNSAYSYNSNGELDIESESQLISDYGGRVKGTYLYDPSHHKYLYEWDYNYDGATFDVDGTGMPSPYIENTTHGIRNFGLRITNPTVPPRQEVYNIPVYFEGREYLKDVQHYDPYDSTSRKCGQAVYATENTFYIIFPSKRNGKWDIYIASAGRYSSLPVIEKITDATTDYYYDPALTVIEDGPNKGIYVVYTRRAGGFENIYSNFGNLDLTGFDPANAKKVTDAPSWFQKPSIVSTGTKLYAYYQHRQVVPIPFNRITRSESSDFGQTWTNQVEVDASSDSQYNPAVVFSTDGSLITRCVWEDGRDEATYGLDLYLNMYREGSLNRTYRVSTSNTLTDEFSPSISNYNGNSAIAYLSASPSGEEADLRIAVTPDYYSIKDVKLEWGIGLDVRYTSPSIVYPGPGVYIVSFGKYDITTGTLFSQTTLYEEDLATGYLVKHYIEDEESAGNVSIDAAETYPGLFCRRAADGYVYELFLARRSFLDGISQETTPFDMQFGSLITRCNILEGDTRMN